MARCAIYSLSIRCWWQKYWQQIELRIKWLLVSKRCFQNHCREKKLYSIQIHLNTKDSLDKKSLLVQVMTWRRIGGRRLTKQCIMIRFNDAYMHHYVAKYIYWALPFSDHVCAMQSKCLTPVQDTFQTRGLPRYRLVNSLRPGDAYMRQ